MRSVSFVLPALNEEENIPAVLDTIPTVDLTAAGWQVEVIVVDNASTDRTADVARALGAIVVHQPKRGYGNAYQAGFAAATGDVIVTGDVDCTYPLDHAERLLSRLEADDLDFLTTNRLGKENAASMKRSHRVANRVLSAVSTRLLACPFVDSQSGMWVFRRDLLHQVTVDEPGMAFSQQLKNAAFLGGFRCAEADIEYRPRGGAVKLNAVRDGVENLVQLARHRVRHGSTGNRPTRRCAPLPALAQVPDRQHVPDRKLDMRDSANQRGQLSVQVTLS